MHELPLTEDILGIVLRHARAQQVRQVRVVHLAIGVLRDIEPEWLQKYFDYLSKQTEAAGARLEVHWVPWVVACDACGAETTLGRKRAEPARCADCGGQSLRLLGGDEFRVRDLEVS